MSKRYLFLICLIGSLFLVGTASADLVLHWKLDDGAGDVAVDSSGNGRDGAVGGTPTWVAGQIGGALDLDGSSNYIDFNSEIVRGTSCTVSLWLMPRDLPYSSGYRSIVHTDAWTAGSLHGHLRTTSLFNFDINGGGAVTSTTTAENDEWFHVAGTFDLDADVSTMYVNGVAEATGSGISTSIFLDTVNFGGYQDGSRLFNGVMDDIRVYDHALTEEEVLDAMVGVDVELASAPDPEDQAVDVIRDVVLSWAPGEFAATHDVYLGTVFDDVNDATRDNPMDVLVSQGQTDPSFTLPERLEYEQTYYWRIDEVNAAPDYTVYKGNVWSFTAEPFAYAVAVGDVTATSNTISTDDQGPERTVDGSGLDENDQHATATDTMWLGSPIEGETPYIQFEFDLVYKLHEMLVWNYNLDFETWLGFGVKDATVEYSVDGENWTALGDVVLDQAPGASTYTYGTVIPFEGVAAKFVRLTIGSSYLSTSSHGLSEVRFMTIPAQAREPQPEDGATDVAVDATLGWRAGREAASHEVYLSTDPNDLVLAGTTVESSYAADLNLAATYTWQVVEVNEAEAIPAWAGDLWTFTTQDYVVVDDFESYIDDETAGDVIWEIWIDGLVEFGGDAANGGSQVGHNTSPFAEQTIVRSGSQSMPLYFDNASPSAISEADMSFTPAQDWSANGIQSLTFWFYGAEGNAGQLYAKINENKVLYDGPAINLVRPSWQMWSIDLSTVDNVSNVTTLSIGVEGTGSGVVYIDDIRLYPEVLEYLTPDITGAGDTVVGVPDDGAWPTAEYPDLAIDDDITTKYLHHNATTEPTGIQVEPLVGSTIVTGLTFTSANDDYGRDPTSFELSGSNTSIDGPYTLIASGEIADFAGATTYPRRTKTVTPIEFENTTAYTYYQIVFPTLRADNDGNMQIAEIELLGEVQ